ncbi:MAG: N-acetylmuramoyl-L-alanine amidase [Oscillospiraceae bacterium]
MFLQAIGLYLEEYLKNDPNYTPFMARRAAVFPSADARWQTANNLEADLLLSIHMNSAVGEAGDGFECYPQVPGETYHTKSLQFARFLATGISDIQNLRGLDGVRFCYNNNGAHLFKESKDKNTEKLRSYYGVVRNAMCLAALSELAFITTTPPM